jgi:hypothetical protein
MTSENRFKQSIVNTLAKRAAMHCSNPDCQAITSGPTEEPLGSINVGEAAHIFGANPGSARFDPSMTPAERATITNAIWLCSTCHKIIDDDPQKYPAGLLFEWQREHEREMAALVGKSGALARKRYQERYLERFGRLSYLAERLITEKDDFWEYHLTSEILRAEMGPTIQRWNALKRGLYLKESIRIEKNDFLSWTANRQAEVKAIFLAASELVNVELAAAWGASGTQGSDDDIINTCKLLGELCKSILSWEESVRFVTVYAVHIEVHALYINTAGRVLDELAKIPTFLLDTLSAPELQSSYELNLNLNLPDGWAEKVISATQRAVDLIRTSH